MPLPYTNAPAKLPDMVETTLAVALPLGGVTPDSTICVIRQQSLTRNRGEKSAVPTQTIVPTRTIVPNVPNSLRVTWYYPSRIRLPQSTRKGILLSLQWLSNEYASLSTLGTPLSEPIHTPTNPLMTLLANESNSAIRKPGQPQGDANSHQNDQRKRKRLYVLYHTRNRLG